MSLALHVEAGSFAELRDKVMKMFPDTIPAVVVTDVVGGAVGGELRKPGRPPKAKMEEAIAANTAAVAPAQVAPVVSDPFTAAEPTAPGGAPAVTFDQVKSALQKLAVLREGEKDPQVGYNRVGAIISKFGVDKVKNLKPEQYASVLEACGQA